MKELQDEFQNSSTAFAAMSQQKAVSNERIKAFSDAIIRAKDQQKETELLLNQAEVTCEQSRQKAQNLSYECSEYEKDIQVLQNARETAKIHAQELYQQSTAFDSEISQIDSILSQHRSSSDRTSERIAGLERRIVETHSEQHQTLASLELLQKEISEKDTLKDGYINAVLHAEQIVIEKQQYVESLQNTITTIQQTLGELQNEKGHHSASIEFLNNLIDTSESSVYLTSSSSWNPKGGKITLAEIIDADESLTIALDAALGEAGKYFVVDNQEEALAGCAELHKNNKGKSSFICTSLIPTVKPLQIFPQSDGIIGLASEIVQVDDHIRNILRILLGKTIIVEHATIAMELAANHKDFSFITLKGEIFSASGIIRGGSTSSSEGKNIGKREQIARLTKTLNLITTNIIELQQSLLTSKNEFNSINLRALNDNVRKAEQDKNTFLQSVEKLIYKKEALEHSLQRQKDALVDFQQQMQNLLQSNTDDKETIEHIIQKKNVLTESKQSILSQYRIAETNLSKAEELYRAAELIIVQKKAEERAAIHEVNRLLELIKQKNDQLQFLENEQKRSNIELQALESSIFSVSKDIDEEQERLQFLKEVIANRESKSLEFKKIRNEAKEYEAKIRAEQHAIMQLIHTSELSLQQAQIEYKRIVEKAEEHSPGIDLVHIPEEWIPPADFDEIIEREKSKKITQRLQNLGNVNFLALEEYEKEHERFEFLKSQLADLSEAEDSLQHTMTEINQTAQQRFHDTFEQIRVHFKHLFSLLFSGSGEADIHLGEGDPLECSIEISAKPPGKRPQSIELLSAGEKTLTAIALLFAIYLVKPSPFCILDEVDAPLDDANIDRYLQLIRSFSDKTQFLMITHNKKTMEAADTLYGITQEEEGVSKVVSVRFTGQDIAV
jgi:chromosome segregation protein